MHEEFNIRLANIDDMENVFELSNDSNVRQNSINKEPILWENHKEWFLGKLNLKSSKFFIIELSNKFAGYYRIDKTPENEWFTTIHIKKGYRNKGLGSKALLSLLNLYPSFNYVALVKKQNIASIKLFKNSNFTEDGIKLINDESYMVLKRSIQ